MKIIRKQTSKGPIYMTMADAAKQKKLESALHRYEGAIAKKYGKKDFLLLITKPEYDKIMRLHGNLMRQNMKIMRNSAKMKKLYK